ncbi:hypothetical protein HZ326_21071 [Fusarium oxysporum f. sp. albedinis]|nr:hypothetical protein HZ326_21071 [Fusarium oxysporum f. sp. albedinis]
MKTDLGTCSRALMNSQPRHVIRYAVRLLGDNALLFWVIGRPIQNSCLLTWPSVRSLVAQNTLRYTLIAPHSHKTNQSIFEIQTLFNRQEFVEIACFFHLSK